jgi:uncharacterized protein YjbI with pentapeptide repeats
MLLTDPRRVELLKQLEEARERRQAIDSCMDEMGGYRGGPIRVEMTDYELLQLYDENDQRDFSDAIVKTTTGVDSVDFDNAILSGICLRNAQWHGAVLGGSLTGSVLSGADVTGAHFKGNDLTRCKLNGTTLYGADLTEATLDGASVRDPMWPGERSPGTPIDKWPTPRSLNLGKATLVGASCKGADFHGADFSGANLRGSNLDGANLEGATFQDADLRDVSGARFDSCNVNGAKFSPNASDPWSVVRRQYSGPMFVLHLLLLVAFVIPYVTRTLMWVGVSHGQEAAVGALRSARDSIGASAPAQETAAAREALDGAEARLREYLAATGRRRYVVEILLGLDRWPANWYLVVLAATLLVYNTFRAVITWWVGLLRDAESRSAFTPALRQYWWCFAIHHCFMRWVLWLAMVSVLLHTGRWLTQSVWVPYG